MESGVRVSVGVSPAQHSGRTVTVAAVILRPGLLLPLCLGQERIAPGSSSLSVSSPFFDGAWDEIPKRKEKKNDALFIFHIDSFSFACCANWPSILVGNELHTLTHTLFSPEWQGS